MIDIQIDPDGVLLARIDMPGRAMNVFSRDLMDALARLMDHAEEEPRVRAVVLTSGKSAFLAGADLEMIKMFTERARDGTSEELHNLFGHLGRLFRRLELHPKPFIAAKGKQVRVMVRHWMFDGRSGLTIPKGSPVEVLA